MGVSRIIIHFRLGFSLVNHPAIGVSPLMETTIYIKIIKTCRVENMSFFCEFPRILNLCLSHFGSSGSSHVDCCVGWMNGWVCLKMLG